MTYRSIWITAAILHLLRASGVVGQTHTGLFLSLRGTPIDDDGFVNAGDIGNNNDDDALLCLTNATNCCGGTNRMGEWYLPNGSVVGSFSDNGGDVNNDFFSRNRDHSVVRLLRYNSPSERGRFRCELLGDTIYVNILTIGPVSISPSTPVTVTAGQTVNLQCSVDITPHPLPAGTSTPEFEWFFGQTFDSPLTSTTTNSGSTYSSTLQLTSVSESDGGMYTCRLRGNHRTAVSTTVTVVPAPTTTAPTPPMVSVSTITLFGDNTAGETYSLVCSVAAIPTPTITWLDDGVEITTDSSRTVSVTTSDGSNRYSSTLTFNPLSASHAGTYTCRATLTSGEMDTDTVMITVRVPTITVRVDAGVATPMAGSTYSLTCTVTGAERLTGSNVAYQWFKDGVMVSGQTMETFSFAPLSFSDAGRYTCQATVTSITTTSSNSVNVTLTLPTPVAAVTSNPTGIITVGSSVTLTCTVELSPSVDVPVTVNTVWTGPAGFMTTNTAQPVMGSTTTYISTAIVNSLGRDKSGDYTCTATVNATSSNAMAFFSIRVIVGSPPPLNVLASQASPSDPVEVSWSPPSGGATTITGYTIFYGNENSGSLPSVTTSISLMLNGDYVGQTVSVCTEAEQLPSQCTNTTVTDTDLYQERVTTALPMGTKSTCSCSVEIGVAVGVMFVLLLLVTVIATVTMVLCWQRRNKDSPKHQDDFAVSSNLAYGEVKLEAMKGDVYEDPDKVVRSVQSDYELKEHPDSQHKPAAPLYETADVGTVDKNTNS